MGFWKAFALHCSIYGLDTGESGSRKRRRALNHFEHGYFTDYEDLTEIAERLAGDIGDGKIAFPAPGRPFTDRSMVVSINPARPDEFYIYACPPDVLDGADAYVRGLLDLPDNLPEALLAERVRRAMEIWNAAKPPEGTIVETYLTSRRLTLTPRPVIRFHPDVYHGDLKMRFPAMVALMTDVHDEPSGVHLTFLARDGGGKAPVDKGHQRRTKGTVKGSAIRLADGDGRLLVGEGIETVLSGRVDTDRPAWSAGGATFLPLMELPPDVREVTILVDGDEAGGINSTAAASKWGLEGRSVVLAHAPDGKDFNDLLCEAAA